MALSLDATYLKVRQGGRILRTDGRREIIGLGPPSSYERAHTGLKAARRVFDAAWQSLPRPPSHAARQVGRLDRLIGAVLFDAEWQQKSWWIAGADLAAMVSAASQVDRPLDRSYDLVLQCPEGMTVREAAERFAAAKGLKSGGAPLPALSLIGKLNREIGYAVGVSRAMNDAPERLEGKAVRAELGRPRLTVEDFARGAIMIDRVADLPEGPIARRFYELVFDDPLLGPLFPDRSARHPERLALYLAEIFRGNGTYARERRGLPTLVARHRGWRGSPTPSGSDGSRCSPEAKENGAAAETLTGLTAYFEETAMLAQHESRQGRAKRFTERT